MNQPSVCAVCVTADRPELTAQAVQSFERQTYSRKRLVILDTSREAITPYRGHFQHCEIGGSAKTIGELRNQANAFVGEEIIVHWDSDDLSNKHRIEEQVALLESSRSDVVGYNRMLLWREPKLSGDDLEYFSEGECWIYTGEILGTSLCYWRRTWEQTPFKSNHILNEDGGFISEIRGKGGKVLAVDSVCLEPRMIARMHAGNASNPAYNNLEAAPLHWTRAAQWDDYCRQVCER